MTSEDLTESALTSELDNLTALHKESDLQGSHDSRRTDTGFLIRASRLPNCVLLPGTNILNRSWIWEHGVLLGYRKNDNDIKKHWLCKSCYDTDEIQHPLLSYLLNVEKRTTKVIDHLENLHGFDRISNKRLLRMSKKRK